MGVSIGNGRLLATSSAALLLAGTAAIATAPPVARSPVAHPNLWPRAHSPAAITDAATERRITRMIAGMTLEQKVGQTIQADISSIKPEDLDVYPLGSILAGGNSGPFGDERSSSSRWAELVRQYRAHSKASGGIAVLFGVDAVHGHSNLPGATIFPHNVGLGATRDPALIRAIGAATADEVTASGIEWTFAPTIAAPQDVRWGRSYEGYSSDDQLVATLGRAMVLGLQGALVAGRPVAADKVAATPKHFLADGGTFNGKDQGDARISERELIARHAQGYPPAIDAGALTVMVSFSSWNGAKHHGNRSLITDVLKGRMGFQGLTVGDWNAHGQVDGCTTTHCPATYNAGLDLFMAPDSWKGLYQNTLADVREGRIPMARIDDAVRRVLRVKAKLGLLDGRSVRDDPSRIGTDAHRALARRAVAESLVLLKNEGSVLPIRPGARILVAGAGADNMARQAGGWTITWQGTDTSKRDFPKAQTIYDGIAEAARASGSSATLSVDGSFSERPDVAIVVFGEEPYAEFQGDVPTLAYQPQAQTDLALLRKLKSAGVKVVSVFLSGRPMFVSPEINASDAFVAAWLPGTEGGGVADVLIAGRDGRPRRDFTGKLAFAWPRDARSPVVRPLFPLGYGQSYAHPVHIPTLSEAPGVDIKAALNLDRYFENGRALAPWTMTLVDDGGARPVGAGPVSSPTGAVSARPVDLAAQEDSRQVRWVNSGSLSIDGPKADLSRELGEGFAVIIEGRVDQPATGPVTLSFAGVAKDVAPAFARAGALRLAIPLHCFTSDQARLMAVDSPVRIKAAAPLTATIKRIGLAAVADQTCPLTPSPQPAR
ncbi:exo 1,3/1,4-beta-D-glucan glucohydrolase [Sphingomonas sp. KRR8]|uniref:glycoside hydrolase family 3 protein n=1 Tax=Sphingomonas sp. KRR8 TaxID=2942996 RepID=UPI0020207978|nr:glycoside hydrolase family 3 protein [Sphingomonas sp. KRR8]URD60895.1 exo 1,3/1,4-beta-D-glucan glucohydrolase [Sphingomonas sp. KRR8]